METLISYQYAILIIVVQVAFVALFGRWAWQDARERGLSKSLSMLAMLLVFCLIPIGLVLWLAFRPARRNATEAKGFSIAEMKTQSQANQCSE